MLLQDYGKVFYYEVIIVDAWSNTLFHDFLHPEIKTIVQNPDPNWIEVTDTGGTHLTGNFPPIGKANLYYYYDAANPITQWSFFPNPTGTCDSREVVLEVSGFNKFSFGTGTSEVSLDFAQGDTFWRGSSLWLRVEP